MRRKYGILTWLTLIQIFLLADSAISSPPVKLPQTGQTSCYDVAGTVIPCIGTGQDGDIRAGIALPSPRFTDNGDQTVTDTLTGLVWAKDGNVLANRDPGFDTDNIAGDGSVSWQNALNYIKKLNQETYLGFSDWRLPNGYELESLVDAGNYYPALPVGNPFANVQGHTYWSSTSMAFRLSSAWTVTVGGAGYFFGFTKTGYQFYVWPVRGGISSIAKTGQEKCYDENGIETSCAGTGQDGEFQSGVAWANPRFTDNNGTVTDNNTGLLWAADANLLASLSPSFDADGTAGDGLVTWQHALDYVKKLNADSYLGFSDWRLPNINELASIIDQSKTTPSLPAGYTFLRVQQVNSGGYWSSTSNINTPGESWVIALQAGGIRSSVNKSSQYSVWPVRGASYMSVSPAIMDLGNVTVGSHSNPITVTITNAVLAPDNLSISSMLVYGNDSASFSINPGDGTAGTCGSLTPVILPGSNCTVSITFTPVASGTKNSTLRVVSSEAASPVISLPLGGTGVLPQYGIDFTADPHGSVSGATSQLIYQGGNSAPVTAVPAAGYQFVNWTGTAGFVATTANPLTVTNVTTTMAITANFAISPVSGACGTSNNGTLTVIPTTNFCTTGTASAVTGTGPWSWTCNGSNGGTTANCSAGIQTFAVTFAAGTNGTLTGATSQMVNYGVSASPVTAVPATGYHFVNWTGTGGFAATTANPLTVTGIAANHYITANFAIDTFLVTPTANTNGTISPNVAQSVSSNGTATFAVAPATGYYIASVTGCGGSLSGNSYVTSAINGNCTVTAGFSLIPDGIMVGSSISISDALRALKIAIGLIIPTAFDLAHGDVAPLVNGKPQPDLKIDVSDALVILRKTIGLVTW